MKIKWNNIAGLIGLVCAAVLLLKLPGVLERTSLDIRAPDYLDDPVYGIMFAGLICITAVAIAKIFTNHKN